ncbi:hypothetical protein OA527_05585 [Pelagibacteraceae bacterium]|nr:hypothetical protein [Pelagibacteraceae bacterium]
MSNIGIKTSAILILIAVLAFSRLIPHPPNFTPLLGMAVFAGARLDSKLFAILAPLTAMFLSDLIIGLHSGMSIIYFAILVNVFFGFYLKERLGPLLIGGTLISGAIMFFIITNFAVWYGSSFYSNDLAGLITCYTMGLPFFQNTLISSLMYGFSAFYLFEFLAKRYLPG